MVYDSWIMVHGLWFRVWSSCFVVRGSWFMVQGSGVALMRHCLERRLHGLACLRGLID